MRITIIIPVLNEAQNIGRLLTHLSFLPNQELLQEIIVCDGGSKDNTIEIAQKHNVNVIQTAKGRAVQMNTGARQANSEMLYFIHVDVLPPHSCLSDIVEAVKNGFPVGCFCYRFDKTTTLLKINEFFNGFDWSAAGGGDQTLYIRREIFDSLNGFDEKLPIMEDFDFVWRIKRKFPFHVIKNRATVSARKYKKNSYLRVQIANALVFFLFKMDVDPHWLYRLYKRLLRS